MGLFDKIFKKPSEKTKWVNMLSGYTPIFSQFGSDIYTSDVVLQAVSCIVTEMKKLQPQHVRGQGKDAIPIKSNKQWLLDNPSRLMTTSDLLEKTIWNLMLYYNAYIIPTYSVWTDKKGIEHRRYKELHPVQPSMVEFEESASGTLYIKMKFNGSGYETTLPYSDVIHIKYMYAENDFLGGGKHGTPDHTALLKTLQINEDLTAGIGSAIKSSFAINGVVKYNSMLDDDKTLKAIKDLEQKLKDSTSGFLPLDMKADFTPLTRDTKIVDAETLKFLDEKILRHIGVPLPILTGDYTKAQYEAFYQKTLEPIIISLIDEFTRVLFTKSELERDNKIRFYPEDLVFMSTDQKLEMVRLLGDSGGLYENEKRVAFGLKPVPELSGIRMQSLNYVDVNIADKYQLGNQKGAEENEE